MRPHQVSDRFNLYAVINACLYAKIGKGPERKCRKMTINIVFYSVSFFVLYFDIWFGCTCHAGLAYAPNFITKIIDGDIETQPELKPRTRFPPEPNGYLHLGHAKSIGFNFGVADQYGGLCNMRLDDTNPSKEEEEYVQSILEDVRWLRQSGDSKDKSAEPWDGDVRLTSNYFEEIYNCALELIKNGDAYVDSLSADEMREYRGTLTEPGKNSPYRERSVEENLELFTGMRNGKFSEGEHILRAKIDMASPNINMRDPTLYRIKHESHQNTGDAWCIYPMYDFSHPISDALENITHSLCTLEFEDHRPFYDWTIDKLLECNLLPCKPQQIEFSRLNLKYTVLSKRKLIKLVEEKHVDGWDDPRMPTLSGVRRRGVQPEALALFCERVGISKADSNIDYGLLEDCIRETMDKTAYRAFAIVKPLKVTIRNWIGDNQELKIPRHPKDNSMGERVVPFGKELFIERSDFFDLEGPEGDKNDSKIPKGFKRLLPGGKVRLKFGYVITCEEIIRDPESQDVVEIVCSYDERTADGVTPEGEKRVKGIIQWVEASTAAKCEIRNFDRLFRVEEPGKETDNYLDDLNPNSIEVQNTCYVESSVAADVEESISEESIGNDPSSLHYQFERTGYFALDKDSASGNLIFNRVVTLRDTWAAPTPKESQRKRGQNKSKSSNQSVGEDATRVAIRACRILHAEVHPNADSLLVCKVDCGDEGGETRTVVAGLADKFSVEELANKQVVCVTNLKPARLVGIESTAMILASEDDGGKFALVGVPEGVSDGELLSFEGYEGKGEPDAMLKSKGAVKVWDRVQSQLQGSEDGLAVYINGDNESCRLMSSQGPATAVAKSKIR